MYCSFHIFHPQVDFQHQNIFTAFAHRSVIFLHAFWHYTYMYHTSFTYNKNCSSQKGLREVLTTLVIWLWGGLSMNTTQAGSMVPAGNQSKGEISIHQVKHIPSGFKCTCITEMFFCLILPVAPLAASPLALMTLTNSLFSSEVLFDLGAGVAKLEFGDWN